MKKPLTRRVAATILLAIMALSAFAATQVRWPDDFVSGGGRYIGQTVEINQTMYVVDNSSWNKYGELSLASERHITPTQTALPGSEDYRAITERQKSDVLILDDGSSQTYPSPRPWADPDGTMRTGMRTDRIVGRIGTKTLYGRTYYTITPTAAPVFYGNRRPTAAPEADGEWNVRVCGFNLEYYLASSFGTGYGPDNAAQAARQHGKIIKAMRAIDADIYGLCEIQLGQAAMEKIVGGLNTIYGTKRYAYIADGTSANGSYTKVGFVYRKDRIAPVRELQSNNTGVKNRKKAQCFRLIENGEKFVVILGHFKAKSGSGSGDNADLGDGQSTYNGDRTREAAALATWSRSCTSYFGDDDVLVIGDLNSFAKEDPIRTLETAGFENQMRRYHADTAYTHGYNTTTGYLDHALASATMARQVVAADAFHINSDEPGVFGYSGYSYADDMYRCSDHDPVVVTLNLGSTGTPTGSIAADDTLLYFADGLIGIAGAENTSLRIYSLTGGEVYRDRITTADYTLAASEHRLAPGVYILTLTDAGGSRTAKKFVVK